MQVVGIDEAHFFPDLLDFCAHTTDALSKHVYVAGLDGDFKRRRFGQACCYVPDGFQMLACLIDPCYLDGGSVSH